MRQRLIIGCGLLLLLVSCGQPDIIPTDIQPLAPISNSGAQTAQPTATVDLTATTMRQTAVVIGATKEAEYLAVEQRFADETATSLAEPPYTAAPRPTFETLTPSPTWEYRLFEHLECTTDEPGPAMFITNCWHGMVNGKNFIVRGFGYRDKLSQNIYGGFLQVFKNDVLVDNYYLPANTGAITIVKELSPSVMLNIADQYEVLFNLETYQWTDLNGVPLVFPPTTTDVPTFPPLTPTP